MNTATINRRSMKTNSHVPYPNAATKEELLHKFLDLLLVAAIGAGLGAAFLFMIAIG